jgi:hypothetical protein
MKGLFFKTKDSQKNNYWLFFSPLLGLFPKLTIQKRTFLICFFLLPMVYIMYDLFKDLNYEVTI